MGDANPVVEVAETEAWVAAWRARRALVGVHEQREDGKPVVKGVAAAAGGAVQDVQIAGSGLGDAIVGLLQGDPGKTQVAAAAVDAPPLEFAVQVPLSFVRSKKVKLTWDPARNALGRVRYTVSVGKRVLARDLDRTSLPVQDEAPARRAPGREGHGAATASGSAARAPRPSCASTASRPG